MTDFSAIKENRDFHRLYRRGKSAVHPLLITYAARNSLGYCRVGITAGKKIGNAVTRNRAKRVIRAAFRSVCGDMDGCYDFVFVARSATAAAKSTIVARTMLEQLKKLGCVKAESSYEEDSH